MLMDHQATESCTGALRSERAWAAPFAGADVSPGVVAMTLATVVQRLTRRADIAIVFRFVGETLGTEERTPLSVDTVAGAHIGRDVAIRQPLQELPIAVGGVGGPGALWSERARTTLLGCPDVVEGAIPINSPPVVQRLTRRADIAILFRFVGETLGTEERTPLSVDT